MTEAEGGGKLRIDKWLWFARFAKTRGLAQDVCESGHVKLNGSTVRKPSTTLKVGDELEIVLDPWRRWLRVEALGTRRGPAPEAQSLYSALREPERLGGAFKAESRPSGDGRPTKKDRRAIDRFKALD